MTNNTLHKSSSQTQLINPEIGFKQFIWKNLPNRLYLFGGCIASIIIWISFKQLYPNANLIFDSFHYLIATKSNTAVYAWPIGYPQFIRLLGNISHSITFLITTQYCILELSFLMLFFTLRYFFRLGVISSTSIWVVFHLNPIFPYTANLVLADTLFTALSLLWLSQLIWIICQPKNWMIYSHAIILLLTFSVRYNALYYPIIAASSFILTKETMRFKLTGIIVPVVLVGSFILFTSFKMESNHGIRQFSPFGGWKLANDALYMYEHVYKQNPPPTPLKFKELDNTVRNYFNRPHDTVNLIRSDVTFGSYYMYIYPSPLMEYMRKIKGDDLAPLNFDKFAPMGPLYQEYGSYLIKKYPLAFAKHFLLPNTLRYLIPIQEVYTDDVNPFYLRNDDLDSSARKWFNITSTSAENKYIKVRHQIFNLYPIVNAIIHIIFILSTIAFLILEGVRKIISFCSRTILIILFLFLLDFTFSIFAAAIVLRYELFITMIEIMITFYFIEYILNIDNQNYPTKRKIA